MDSGEKVAVCVWRAERMDQTVLNWLLEESNPEVRLRTLKE